MAGVQINDQPVVDQYQLDPVHESRITHTINTGLPIQAYPTMKVWKNSCKINLDQTITFVKILQCRLTLRIRLGSQGYNSGTEINREGTGIE